MFLPDAATVLAAKQAMCAEAGFEGVSPLDDAPTDGDAFAIARACERAMDRCDLIVANMTPFRGSGMDSGTAYETGYMRARGKPVFAYSNDTRPYADRLRAAGPIRAGEAGPIDADGLAVENFSLAENLMLAWAAAAAGPGVLMPERAPADPFRDLATFRRAIALARAALG